MADESASKSRIPMWLDVDTGHDDAFALLLAAHSPKANLLGVSTVHGNATLKHTTYNTLSVLEAIGRRDIPVYPGSVKPLYRDAVHADAIHGESGLGGVTLLPKPVAAAREDGDFVEAMYKALAATPPHTAWLVTTGTMTNAGRLFTAHPDLAEHLAGVSVMGGAVGGKFTNAPMGKVAGEGERFGNWTPFAEFNIFSDPEASKSILSNPVLAKKTTLIPLDVSHLCLATKEVRERLLYGYEAMVAVGVPNSSEESSNQTETPKVASEVPHPVRAIFYQTLVFFAQTYAEVFALTEGPPLHDPLTVAAIIEPDIFDDAGGERFLIDVITEGFHSEDVSTAGQLGRTVAVKLPDGEPGIRIPRALDVTRIWTLFEMALQEAERLSPMVPLTEAERSVLPGRSAV